MLGLDEVRVKLADLKQAIELEKQRRFINLQGKRQTFAEFLMQTVQLLLPFAPEQDEVTGLLGQINQYAFMDLYGRMKTLDKVSALVETISIGAMTPRIHTTTHKQVNEGPADREVKFVKGVGPKVAVILNRAGINTVDDLLYYFPRKYLDYHNRLKINTLTEGQEATIIGTIQGVSIYNTRQRNLSIVSVTVKDETGSLQANWIFAAGKRAMLESFRSRFVKGAEMMVSGKTKWDSYRNKLAMDRPETEILSYESADGSDDPTANLLHTGRIVPVYPLVEGLNLKVLRKAIRHALNDYLAAIADPMPADIRKRYQLVDVQTALEQIHFPETFAHYESARKRLVFDELFFIQLRLGLIRAQYKRNIQGVSLEANALGYVESFLSRLPFQLTGAQQRVLIEIKKDMHSHEPMYRLLQGDVGSGKTIVALLTLLIGVENGYQGVLMAPTEILAEQHYRNFIQWLTPMGLKVGLFVGKAGSKERRQLRQDLLNGQIHVAVGTHALIQDGVEFARLGVIVVDEQHRFGVRQRILLKSKGENPEMLTMTATPIPRTLAMTLHGDLDVSILDELPPGRTPIKTVLFTGKSKRQEAYQLILQQVALGRQAYIVFPLIEESENISAKAAAGEYERLSKDIFPHLKVGLLHGKLSPDEKEAVMQAFVGHHLDVLVSTTVIEVGVDVPNATVMLIENADRFGLAQLHQLRGRVGRSGYQSYCMLMSDSRTPETLNRLNIMVESHDGFYIAEKDLELRGPGEFLGTRQSGLPDLVLADLIRDKAILEMAHEAALKLTAESPELADYPELRDMLFHKTEEAFHVVNAG